MIMLNNFSDILMIKIMINKSLGNSFVIILNVYNHNMIFHSMYLTQHLMLLMLIKMEK
jgi:hypothetical protein